MNRLAVETPFRPVPRALQFPTSARQHSVPTRKSFDDAGAALSEPEVSELAVGRSARGASGPCQRRARGAPAEGHFAAAAYAGRRY
jgi:hypothetical protein